MRVVRLPHDVVDADQLTQLDARFLVPEVDVNLPAKNFAGSSANTLRPQAPLLPLVIAGFEHITHPAESGFGARPFQARIAVEYAGEDQIWNQLRRRRAKSRGGHGVKFPFGEAIPLRQRKLFGQSRRAMPVHGNPQVLAASPKRLPERIVHALEALLRKRRLSEHHDATVAAPYRTLYLADDNVDLAHVRNNRDRNIAIANFAPLGQRIVVRPHASELERRIGLKKTEI